MREFIIGPNDSGQRADKFLTKAVPSLPRPLLYKYLRMKRIKCNGKRCEISTQLQEGDVIQLYINDEFFLNADDRHAFLAAPSSLGILYEDENLLLLTKPAGLVVHEDSGNSADTLINRVQRYLFEKGEYDPERENSFAPALCNRIDRNTQGIVIAAKNAEALRILNQTPFPPFSARTAPLIGWRSLTGCSPAVKPSSLSTEYYRRVGASPWRRWN